MAVEHDELLALSTKLLQAIDARDWEAYAALCDPELTAYEPEAGGHLIVGLPFHKFYFDLNNAGVKRQSTICSPHVQMSAPTCAVVTYVRLVQTCDREGKVAESAGSETRVWVKGPGGWKHTHFHRSPA